VLPTAQTFDNDDIAVDGKLDDYTGTPINGRNRRVRTQARNAYPVLQPRTRPTSYHTRQIPDTRD
jgi:hypothetical protein